MSTLVERNQDISEILNGEFVFCKELKKGLIKKDFSDLSANTFEGIVNAIEGLSLKQLDLLGFNTTLFAGNYDENKGEIILSTKRDKTMYAKIEEVRSIYPTENDISQFFGTELTTNRYFNLEKMNDITADIREMDTMRRNSKCINIKGVAIEGFIIIITGPGINIKDLIGVDGIYDIPVCGLFMGIWQLQIKIYQNEESVTNETPLIVKDIDVVVPNKDLSIPEEDAIEYVSEPIDLVVQPYERVEIKDENGVVIGQGVADRNGHVSIKTISYSEPSSYSVAVNGYPFSPTETITPIIKPNTLPANRAVSYKTYTMEVPLADLPTEESPIDGNIHPYIVGTNTPCSNIEFKIENGISIGISITDQDGNFKVYLDISTFDINYDGELFILVTPLNIDCKKAIDALNPKSITPSLIEKNNITSGTFLNEQGEIYFDGGRGTYCVEFNIDNITDNKMFYFEIETIAGSGYSIENDGEWVSYNSGMGKWERIGILIDLKNENKWFHIRNGEAFFDGDSRWQSTPITVDSMKRIGFRRYNSTGHIFNVFFDSSSWTQVGNLDVSPLRIS